MNELNIKLAKWVGLTYDLTGAVQNPDSGLWSYGFFTESLDACFKWLVPKFKEMCASRSDYESSDTCDNDIHIFLRFCEGGGWTKKGWIGSIKGFRTEGGVEGVETAALAFCLALEKLIDSEVK